MSENRVVITGGLRCVYGLKKSVYQGFTVHYGFTGPRRTHSLVRY